jgi:two-component system cell cycle response regulator
MTLPLDDLLKPLRGLYLSQLRERIGTVDNFVNHLKEGSVSVEERGIMIGLSHKLAGSGTTYGFPVITQTARTLEEVLSDPNATHDRIENSAESLAHACSQALLAIERGSGDRAVRGTLPSSVGKPVLLVVDDDPVIRETLSELFGRDFEVMSATDGAEGLILATQNEPHLVLVDYNMPHMTGVEFVKALRSSGPSGGDIPVIMLTANSHALDEVAALGVGVSDCVLKPFEPHELSEKVRDLLHRSGRTVLIADDDPAIRNLLAYKFRLAGVRVIMAADGEEAWRMVSEYRPHLAILDRMMPGLDGVAVLRKMREHDQTKKIPVMFLTALRQEKDILEGFRTGVSDYVIKPFLPEEVLARGLRLLDFHQVKQP